MPLPRTGAESGGQTSQATVGSRCGTFSQAELTTQRMITDRYHFPSRVRRPFRAFRTVTINAHDFVMRCLLAAGRTMPSCGCRCRYVQLERVHLPSLVTGNSYGGIEGDGMYISSAIQRACSRWPTRSHTRTEPSPPPLTAVRPSALTATAETAPSWPVSTRGAAVPARSHTRTVPSAAVADRGPPVRADRHRPHPAVVAGEDLPERLARLREGGPDRAQPGCVRPRPRRGVQPGQRRLAPSDRPPGELGRQLVRVNRQDVRGQPDRGLHQGQAGLVRDGGVVGEQPGHSPAAAGTASTPRR